MSETRIIICPKCGYLGDVIIEDDEVKLCSYCGNKTRVTDLTPNHYYNMTNNDRFDYVVSSSTKLANGESYDPVLYGKRYRENAKKINQSSTPQVKCPKCGSTQIEIKKRGWKITTGFLGSSKNERVCVNCLHKF